MASSQMLADLQRQDQHSTAVLRERASSIRQRIDQLALIEQQMNLEIRQLLPVPIRLRRAEDAMALVYSVAAECLEIRARRPESDLTADQVEKLLMEEATAAHEGRVLAARCAAEVEAQIAKCRNELNRLHSDWSLKTIALTAERRAIAQGREEGSMKQAGSMAPTETTGPPPEEWERNAVVLLQCAEEEREKAMRLRARVEPLIRETGRDVSRRNTLVDEALTRNIDVLIAMLTDLKAERLKVLEKEACNERLQTHLEKAAYQTEPALKSAQSRLVERRARPPIERTSDEPQSSLLGEVGSAIAMDTAIKDRLADTRACWQSLVDKRCELEREIGLKTRSLYLDRERVRLVRTLLPTRTALQGME